MDSNISDQSASAPEEMPKQSKEADAILPAITPKDGDPGRDRILSLSWLQTSHSSIQ